MSLDEKIDLMDLGAKIARDHIVKILEVNAVDDIVIEDVLETDFAALCYKAYNEQ